MALQQQQEEPLVLEGTMREWQARVMRSAKAVEKEFPKQAALLRKAVDELPMAVAKGTVKFTRR